MLVVLLQKWKKCSWVVTRHPTDHLDIGHILQFDSTLHLRYSADFPLREKWKNLNLDVSLVALSACIGGLAPVLWEEDASSSKRANFLHIMIDGFMRCKTPEKIDYEKANVWKLKSYLKGFKQVEQMTPSPASKEKFLSNVGVGVSYHMTYKSDYLFDFEEYDGGNILLGDGRECRVRGTGKVQVHMRDGSSFVLENIRYVLELRRNFILLGTLEKEGFTMKT
ncbi:hypothetical protein Tco_0642580 [Tanacetum coccineum]